MSRASDIDKPRPNVGGPQRTLLRFDHFAADLRTRELHKHGLRIRLAEKPFLVLAALLERPGELVTREELRTRLWATDTFVDFDNNLNSAVATLREVLCDSARSARYVETLPRLGYRFVGRLLPEVRAVSGPEPRGRFSHAPLWVLSACAGILLAAVAMRQVHVLFSAASDGPRVAGSLPAKPPEFVDAMYLLQRDEADGLKRATAVLQRALETDPLHAPSHAALAEAWIRLTLRGQTEKDEGFALAERAARRTLEINAADSSAHRTLALVLLHRDWNFAAATQASQRAVTLQTDVAANHLVAATVSASAGKFDDAIESARRAIQLDPANWRVRADLAYFLLSGGHLEEAVAECRAVLALDAGNRVVQDFLLAASERLGQFEDARAAAVRLMESGRAPHVEISAVRSGNGRSGLHRYRSWQVRYLEERADAAGWPPMTRAAIYATAGQTDRAFQWLERAYGTRDSMLVLLAASPDFVALHGDPRFAKLARLIGAPPPNLRSQL